MVFDNVYMNSMRLKYIADKLMNQLRYVHVHVPPLLIASPKQTLAVLLHYK